MCTLLAFIIRSTHSTIRVVVCVCGHKRLNRIVYMKRFFDEDINVNCESRWNVCRLWHNRNSGGMLDLLAWFFGKKSYFDWIHLAKYDIYHPNRKSWKFFKYFQSKSIRIFNYNFWKIFYNHFSSLGNESKFLRPIRICTTDMKSQNVYYFSKSNDQTETFEDTRRNKLDLPTMPVYWCVHR